MTPFNPPELRRLRRLLRRQFGAKGTFAEQVEAVAPNLAPTPGSRLAFLERVHRELSLERSGEDAVSPEAFRQACEVLAADLGSEAQPVPALRGFLSWLLLLVGVGALLSGLDVREADWGRLAVLGPLYVVVCLPVIFGFSKGLNPVAWAVALLGLTALGYLTNVHVTPAFLWGALLLQVGLLTGTLSPLRRGVFKLVVGLELAVSALVFLAGSRGHDLQGAGVLALLLAALAAFSLIRLHHPSTSK